MDEGFYSIETTRYKFELNLYKYDNIYAFEFGDPANIEGACVGLTYDTNKPTILKLDHLSYYKRCSKDKDLLKGTGTQEMLQTILKLCIEHFPNIKKVVFNDVSFFECNNQQILLSVYYLLLYGETWYESKFGAKIAENKNKLCKFKALLNEKPQNNIFSFYDSSKEYTNWHTYFRTMSCENMMKHKKEIDKVAGIRFMYSEWYIKRSTIMKYDINMKIKQIKTGGNVNIKPTLKFIIV